MDRDSTAQLDVSAQWEEWIDAGEPASMDEIVAALPVGRIDHAAQIRHEFGDTRHRAITYTLTAAQPISAVLRRLRAGLRIRVQATMPSIHIPSSARPAPPVILSVVPAMRWETSDGGEVIRHLRHGGRLRVELGRPWYTTGQDRESLAVIAAPDRRAR